MRMTIKSISVVFCLGLLCFPVLAAEMSVQVKQAQLRAKPGPLAKVEVTLAYGARVNVLEEQTDWILVNVPLAQITLWPRRKRFQVGAASFGQCSERSRDEGPQPVQSACRGGRSHRDYAVQQIRQTRRPGLSRQFDIRPRIAGHPRTRTGRSEPHRRPDPAADGGARAIPPGTAPSAELVARLPRQQHRRQ